MEVILADALNVMQKRASDVLEVPLYDKAMVQWYTPEPNQKELEQAAFEVVPTSSSVQVAKKPSLHRAEKQVVVQYVGEADEQILQTAAAHFAEKTEWQLLFKRRP